VKEVEEWTTRRGKPRLPNAGAPVSATLLYHKWHAYDSDGDFDTKSSRVKFLSRVAALTNGALAGYPAWYDRYFDGLKALGVNQERTVMSATTVWRLVVGFATNPALETGLSLHLLHGFPYLPGSAVRGLVRRVAEYELVKAREAWFELPGLPPEEKIDGFLTEAEELRALFGSLAVDPPDPAPADPLWRTPRELLLHLRSRLAPEADALRKRISSLLSEHTGGVLTFYDAVPARDDLNPKGLLETDLLNPHYPDFYRRSGGLPPSDDQDPTPIYFLVVKPDVTFHFPFRIGRWPRSESRDDPRAAVLAGTSSEAVQDKVLSWLTDGLQTWGAGAKTAAGYGYFKLPGKNHAKPETPKRQGGNGGTKK
jgi:CRISPR-associated protein Cmr6